MGGPGVVIQVDESYVRQKPKVIKQRKVRKYQHTKSYPPPPQKKTTTTTTTSQYSSCLHRLHPWCASQRCSYIATNHSGAHVHIVAAPSILISGLLYNGIISIGLHQRGNHCLNFLDPVTGTHEYPECGKLMEQS